MGDDDQLTVCQERLYWSTYHERTGIFVRAKSEGKWGSCDIALLDRDSLLRWLHPKSKDFTVSVVMSLLGHDQTVEGGS